MRWPPHVWVHKPPPWPPLPIWAAPASSWSGKRGASLRFHCSKGLRGPVGTRGAENVILLTGVQTLHYNYVGDSILGLAKSHYECRLHHSNVKSEKASVWWSTGEERIDTAAKQVMLATFVEVGCNMSWNPGTVIGPTASSFTPPPASGVSSRAQHLQKRRHRPASRNNPVGRSCACRTLHFL